MPTPSRVRTLLLRAAVPAVLGLTAVAGLAPPAHAAISERYDSCSAGGFTGTVRVVISRTAGQNDKVVQISYRIDKGSQPGGNSANVGWKDYGVLPPLEAYTASGKQDNRWHVLREADYYRGSGDAGGRFVFDKSRAADPSCTYDIF